ncbi:hypothetical protein KEM54_002994 [Ascosphaera aggregata]|nr:hypothetical protein KEM54_002994 [Ascosphaera aggregata]
MPFLNSTPPSPSLPTLHPSTKRIAHHARVRSAPSLSLDLSSITSSFRFPKDSYASNTLLLTGLEDLRHFQPATLDAIKNFLQELAPLNSFSPLPSFRRIVVSFREVGDAVKVRTYLEIKGLRTTSQLSGAPERTILVKSEDGNGYRSMMVREANAIFPRIYFGETTPLIEDEESSKKKNFLGLPPAAKLFFISPPPSPPAGWQMRNEDPPNKEVHATDLEVALKKLGGTPLPSASEKDQYSEGDDYELARTPVSISPTPPILDSKPSQHFRNRSMSATIIYNPEDHGSGASDLPAVMVEDTTAGSKPPKIEVQGGTETSPVEKSDGVPELRNVKTPRPPVELMH